jgi:3-(3-hydroxy-phenyl)propionate hydroxylase
MSGPLVAVVGAGPVGALASLELARRGIGVVLFEARTDVSWTSRAICISRRSMEILDRAGVGEMFAAKGLPWSRGRTFHHDRLVFELDLPHSPGDRHAPFINLQQCYTERFLIDALTTVPNAPDLRWGHRVTRVGPSREGVRIEVEGPNGSYSMDADWLIAADGARSIVRSSLGLELKGTSYEGRYLISDIVVEGGEWPVERYVWFDARANPGSTVILHVQPDGVWRIDMQLHENEDPEAALADEQLLPRLQAQLDTIGATAPWRLVWKSVYRAHSLSLDSYRHGRVLFAGDAAHLVPIFGVRGLNSGFDDAHNFAWKLAMVALGEAPDHLLDSYSFERRKATSENIANADKSTWFMSPPTAGFRRMRDAALLLAGDEAWARSLINPRQASFHVYDGSPIVLGDDRPGEGVRPGSPVPNLPLGDDHLHQALAPLGFSALLFENGLSPDLLSDAAGECDSLGIKPVVIGRGEGAIHRRFAADDFPLYLVRPDEHVAARLRADQIPRLKSAYGIAVGGRATHAAPREEVQVATPIEEMYEALSTAIDRAEAANDPVALERIALTLAHALGDPALVRSLIEKALARSDVDSGVQDPGTTLGNI